MPEKNGRWFKVGFWAVTVMVGLIVTLVGVNVRTTVGGVEGQVRGVEHDVEQLSHSNGKAHGEILTKLKEQNGDIGENSRRISVNEATLGFQAESNRKIEARMRQLENNQAAQLRLLEKIDSKIP